MPPWLRVALLFCLSTISWWMFSTRALGQIVLTELDFTFTKADFADPTLPANQDRITPELWITRGAGGGVYNAAVETQFPTRDPDAISPQFTEWATNINNPGATIGAADWESLTFGTWLNAYGGLSGVAANIVGLDAVLRILRDDGENNLADIYLDVRFTSWTSGGAGGFAYERAALPSGDYNGDGTVNAADYTIWRDTLGQSVTNPGDGADGDLSSMIDLPDYEHWKARFGNLAPGTGGEAAAVPEPTTVTLLALVVWLLAATRVSDLSARCGS